MASVLLNLTLIALTKINANVFYLDLSPHLRYRGILYNIPDSKCLVSNERHWYRFITCIG
jgi:hypothetical protein